jgi:hypothetical protein
MAATGLRLKQNRVQHSVTPHSNVRIQVFAIRRPVVAGAVVDVSEANAAFVFSSKTNQTSRTARPRTGRHVTSRHVTSRPQQRHENLERRKSKCTNSSDVVCLPDSFALWQYCSRTCNMALDLVSRRSLPTASLQLRWFLRNSETSLKTRLKQAWFDTYTIRDFNIRLRLP